jgi:hypothetical protein
MEYFLLAMIGAAILFIARSIFIRLQRWHRSHRLRGAKACLDAVHDTLNSLAKSNPKVS